MPVQYEKDEHERIMQAIVAYWHDEFGEDIGVIKSQALFDFFNGLVGSAAYNRGVRDAQAYLQAKLLDLDIDLYEEIRDRPQA